MPILKPVIPDPGVRFQFVHEDDVASAFLAGTLGKGQPGPYNLAAPGTLKMSDIADELDWYTVPVPDAAVEATAEIMSRLPSLPEAFAWVHRAQAGADEDRPREGRAGLEAGHTAKQTLKQLVAAYAPRRNDQATRPLALQGLAEELLEVLLGRLARVQQRAAVAHGALHERRDAALRHAHLRAAAAARASA